LIADSSGALYGTTEFGGGACITANAEGCGTVFKLTPTNAQQTAWTETVLYRFTGNPNDGAEPKAGLIADPNGTLYGTTSAGGGSSCGGRGCGVVFELTPPTAGAPSSPRPSFTPSRARPASTTPPMALIPKQG
jgi:uncharacterized repeat protein (TIGR03803 family)